MRDNKKEIRYNVKDEKKEIQMENKGVIYILTNLHTKTTTYDQITQDEIKERMKELNIRYKKILFFIRVFCF